MRRVWAWFTRPSITPAFFLTVMFITAWLDAKGWPL